MKEMAVFGSSRKQEKGGIEGARRNENGPSRTAIGQSNSLGKSGEGHIVIVIVIVIVVKILVFVCIGPPRHSILDRWPGNYSSAFDIIGAVNHVPTKKSHGVQ